MRVCKSVFPECNDTAAGGRERPASLAAVSLDPTVEESYDPLNFAFELAVVLAPTLPHHYDAPASSPESSVVATIPRPSGLQLGDPVGSAALRIVSVATCVPMPEAASYLDDRVVLRKH